MSTDTAVVRLKPDTTEITLRWRANRRFGVALPRLGNTAGRAPANRQSPNNFPIVNHQSAINPSIANQRICNELPT
jgi:hypothetical protein